MHATCMKNGILMIVEPVEIAMFESNITPSAHDSRVVANCDDLHLGNIWNWLRDIHCTDSIKFGYSWSCWIEKKTGDTTCCCFMHPILKSVSPVKSQHIQSRGCLSYELRPASGANDAVKHPEGPVVGFLLRSDRRCSLTAVPWWSYRWVQRKWCFRMAGWKLKPVIENPEWNGIQ